MMVKLNETLLTLCSKADSDLSRTFKIVLFPKLGKGFIFNYFCKSLHTTRLAGFLMRPLVIGRTLMLHHITIQGTSVSVGC